MDYQQYFSQVGALSMELTIIHSSLQSEVDLGGAIHHAADHTYPLYEVSVLASLPFLPLLSKLTGGSCLW